MGHAVVRQLSGRRRWLSCYQRLRPMGPTKPLAFHYIRLSSSSSGIASLDAVEYDKARSSSWRDALAPLDTFPRRHIGLSPSDIPDMLKALDPPVASLDELIQQVIPNDILSSAKLEIAPVHSSARENDGCAESQLLERLREIAGMNKVLRSYIGRGYAGTLVPEVIKRNVLESPAWYTSYTPYQPEISQGRLESLLNFQTMVSDLTGLPISNASLLDEPTAAAEAMTLSLNALSSARLKRPIKIYVVSHLCHPQTIAVLESRAEGFGVTLQVEDLFRAGGQAIKYVGDDLVGVLGQYPDTEGGIRDFQAISDIVHSLGATFSVATDLLALTLLKPPGEFGADVAFGNSQRFGVPFGYGGPHAAFFACSEKHKRKIPGRLVGVSKDRMGNRALRLALQTREQHIRREKATSNICTAQALLANMSAFYAIYHGPTGLKAIAERIRAIASALNNVLRILGFETGSRASSSGDSVIFDTIVVDVKQIPGGAKAVSKHAVESQGINFRIYDEDRVGFTIDETVREKDFLDMTKVFQSFSSKNQTADVQSLMETAWKKLGSIPHSLKRQTSFLEHPVFNTHHSETELLRYIYHLQSKDMSLAHAMIPLGSCTMKLNATTEMIPVTWPEFANIHPFAPVDQAQGYHTLINELEADLASITGFDAVSLQPNSGAQGEFAGLRVIRKYLKENGGENRDVCLIPVSAHGTNPASAAMAGMRVVTVKCETKTGNLDLEDLKAKCEKYEKELGAIMITYPSTFGVFEPKIKAVCDMVHSHGGQVYMDGANMNAQIGFCSPALIGADVCHLNLHKTFCIPHGGGGPGVGPIGVKSHLADYLPETPLVPRPKSIGPVSGAPWGSAGILPISWSYIKMMGGHGLTQATQATLLSANYLLSRLRGRYRIGHTNSAGRCGHEFVLDGGAFADAGIGAQDLAKRLQDYGFHAPTVAWPVANALMIEPTESESRAELDRFADALLAIADEVDAVRAGRAPRGRNLLTLAPHPVADLLASPVGGGAAAAADAAGKDGWDRPYSRDQAAFPLPYLREKKFWPAVARLDDAYGDTNLFCTCSPVDSIE